MSSTSFILRVYVWPPHMLTINQRRCKLRFAVLLLMLQFINDKCCHQYLVYFRFYKFVCLYLIKLSFKCWIRFVLHSLFIIKIQFFIILVTMFLTRIFNSVLNKIVCQRFVFTNKNLFYYCSAKLNFFTFSILSYLLVVIWWK